MRLSILSLLLGAVVAAPQVYGLAKPAAFAAAARKFPRHVPIGILLMLLGTERPRLHYLIAATLATEASTTWLFVLTERLVFRGAKPGTVRSRAIRFFLLNNLALLVRLPLLALAVEWLGVPVVPANVATLVLPG